MGALNYIYKHWKAGSPPLKRWIIAQNLRLGAEAVILKQQRDFQLL